ncbi:hypothetical protein L5515_015434 [Caenorhabditis briggsae]|uniref:Uncharacterized protein n=1 Tax=Caenorhabditis briggsae TaxID=6238 RepID=A0AAE9EEW3_CAEBR|nr:hypothetical protein L5515_015434 [Caenorhabditis briggsae]
MQSSPLCIIFFWCVILIFYFASLFEDPPGFEAFLKMVAREQTKEELQAIIAQKDLQIAELKNQLNLSKCQVFELKESYQKASAQGYQQGLAENSRLLVYFEKKATKLMCRLS